MRQSWNLHGSISCLCFFLSSVIFYVADPHELAQLILSPNISCTLQLSVKTLKNNPLITSNWLFHNTENSSHWLKSIVCSTAKFSNLLEQDLQGVYSARAFVEWYNGLPSNSHVCVKIVKLCSVKFLYKYTVWPTVSLGNSPVLHCAYLLRIILRMISARALENGGFFFTTGPRWKLKISRNWLKWPIIFSVVLN